MTIIYYFKNYIMQNFSIKKDGKEYWVARNVAVVCFVFAPINGEWCVLANQRGKGTPNYQGLWNCPCGYLDYNETTKDAAIRETYEETGVQLNKVKFWSFNDDPTKDDLQNVTFRYFAVIEDPQPSNVSLSTEALGGEENEVSSVAWIPLDTVADYEWAFDHDILIITLQEMLDLE
jgi:8-oxo-dGTP pyrophosphatase MutT (NUDIX family)